MKDQVDHPRHYNASPSGVECITVVEHMSFNLGNATKFIWRAGLKSPDPVADLEKAKWYIEREIGRLRQAAVQSRPDGAPPIIPEALPRHSSGSGTAPASIRPLVFDPGGLEPSPVGYTTITNCRDV